MERYLHGPEPHRHGSLQISVSVAISESGVLVPTAVVVVAGLVVSGSATGALRVHGGCHEAQPPDLEPELERGACRCHCAIL